MPVEGSLDMARDILVLGFDLSLPSNISLSPIGTYGSEATSFLS
ncbi:hypothetical protein MANES_08G068460v8 [Manihot esculenta]|uniref:Uncharacterized protein n=1 Tax=Manihot esculenta TaxID=3983 RepID=A0ACB7HAZ8_MANES|nr:hypothetical protein MANES_08G068460v8 [Manihot esculenta]